MYCCSTAMLIDAGLWVPHGAKFGITRVGLVCFVESSGVDGDCSRFMTKDMMFASHTSGTVAGQAFCGSCELFEKAATTRLRAPRGPRWVCVRGCWTRKR
jgi:hypothetical protein